ncbi:hypothetical protein SUGI_0437990 [Cryptomeria japonica]|nr:hypothetical protein SUGI_0437990 [Cryptomeria japonica]
MGGEMSKGNYGRVGQEPDWINDYKEACKNDSDVRNFDDKLDDDLKRVANVALQCIAPANSPPGTAQYDMCKEKLEEFKAAENPFNKNFFDLLESVHTKNDQIM